jgi:serine/threonine protein kinase KIN1/2
VTYPTSLTQVAEEFGGPTPTHGGTVNTGSEYDYFIAEKLPPTNQEVLNAALPTPTPRRSMPTTQRPRPMSMPPQAYGQPTTPTPAERDRIPSDALTKRSQSKEQNSSVRSARSSNRILGDYTLSKTLGAGSMGKVKLAHHSVSDETASTYFTVWSLSCLTFL